METPLDLSVRDDEDEEMRDDAGEVDVEEEPSEKETTCHENGLADFIERQADQVRDAIKVRFLHILFLFFLLLLISLYRTRLNLGGHRQRFAVYSTVLAFQGIGDHPSGYYEFPEEHLAYRSLTSRKFVHIVWHLAFKPFPIAVLDAGD